MIAVRLHDAPQPQSPVRQQSGCKVPVSPSAHEDWADVARVIAISLVVVVHVLNLDKRFVTVPVDSANWVAMDAVVVGTRWALPIFVMISGYLLLDPRKQLDWGDYYRRRLQRIAWPLLAWTVLYLGLSICDDMVAGQPVVPARLAGLLIKGSPYYHLWYLYMLPGLYVVCPLVKLATDRMNQSQLTGAVLVCFGVTIFSGLVDGLYSVPNVTYIDDFPRYLGYFLAGHLLGRVVRLPSIVPAAAVLVTAFVIGAIAIYVVAQMASPSRAMRLLGYANPTIVAMSLAAFAIMRRASVAATWRPWIAWAGEASFGVYLVHPAVLDGLQHWAAPDTPAALTLAVLFVALLSLLVVLAMQRFPIVCRWV